MTIRYECQECDSVLKIRDEKAGKPARCPKCKAKFTVPIPGERVAVGAGVKSAGGTEDAFAEDPIDMPLEVTPDVELPQDDPSGGDFDPMAVLDGTSLPPTKAARDDNTPKPTVAELMKEHQAKQKKGSARDKRQSPKVNDLLVSSVETSGSAADAITRSYEKKRSGEGDEPISRAERRAAEERAALTRFAIQGTVGLALVLGVSWGFWSWMASEDGVPLVEVTGRVTVKGLPGAGLRVQFDPVLEPNGPKPPGGGSWGKTDNDGNYRLQFDAARTGAIVWNHQVKIENELGMLLLPPTPNSQRDVKADAENNFDFNL